jgi:hypothetical protein
MYRKIALLAAVATLSASHAYGAQIGMQFSWNQYGVGLASTDVAGVVPQDNYNVFQDYSGYTNGFTITNVPMNDAVNGSPTSITLSAVGNTGSSRIVNDYRFTPDEKLLDNYDAGTAVTYTFNGVPAGQYDVYVYTATDQSSSAEGISLGTQTYYMQAEYFNEFNAPANGPVGYPIDPFPGYMQATNDTDPTSFPVANYAEFADVSPTAGAFAINTTNSYITGFQLVPVPEPSVAAVLSAGVIGLLNARRMRAKRDPA